MIVFWVVLFHASQILSLTSHLNPLPPFLNASSPSLPPCTPLSLSLSLFVAMSEEGGGVHESFFWENQSWGLTNSDNSAGSEEKLGKEVPGSSSNSQTEIGVEEAAPPPVKKKGRGGVSRNGKGNGEGREGKGVGESDHEIHIWTERERRKKMRNMFANLHALLPQLPPKVTKYLLL